MTFAFPAAKDRFDLWAVFLNEMCVRRMAEIGVRKGVFAEHILRRCPSIEQYYMVDPWRHLPDWNKRGNVSNEQAAEFFSLALWKTDFAREKVSIIRAVAKEAARMLPDEELDFIYIDGDHTLRGITLDLLTLYGKVKTGGFIGGDDFTASIWQHDRRYEPSLVFPFAVHFAEAMDCPIYALPFDQFVILKGGGFRFVDETGKYSDLSLLRQMAA